MNLFTVTDISALSALDRYATAQGLRGKDIIETVRKAFRYWVSFAIAKIPKGDAQKIRADLTTIVTTYSRLSARNARNTTARASKWRGTLALRLVYMLDWQGARLAAAFGDIEGAAAKAALFTNRRAFAANLHRSGLREAVMRLRNVPGSNPGRLPKFKEQPGSYDERLTENIVTILAENWASAAGDRADGITGRAPNAFTDALPEVDRLIASFLVKDVATAAEKSGFTVEKSA